MAITSVGYDGTVDEVQWATLSTFLGSEYAVGGSGDWRVSIVTGLDRTVRVAAGVGYGYGVMDESDTAVDIQLPTVGSTYRWDLIVARRDWQGGGGVTTFEYVQGTTAEAIPAGRLHEPGVEDDQPLALVKVIPGQTTPQQVIDLRTWPSRAMMANSIVGLRDSLPVGGVATVAGVDYHKVLDDAGTPILTPRDRKPFAAIHRGATASVGTGFWPIVFDVAYTGNTPGMWDSSSKITVPMEGLYLILGGLSWGGQGTGDTGVGNRAVHLRFNNGNFVRGQSMPAAAGYWTTGSVSHIAYMKAGDYVELYSEQDSGSWVPVPGGGPYAAESPARLSVAYLMPAGGDGLARSTVKRPITGFTPIGSI